MPGIEKCFKVDSLSTVAGSFFCMPVMTTYLESASGVEDGGRTGLTAIVTSILFALMLLFTPLAMMVPGVATGPVLTIIGFQDVYKRQTFLRTTSTMSTESDVPAVQAGKVRPSACLLYTSISGCC